MTNLHLPGVVTEMIWTTFWKATFNVKSVSNMPHDTSQYVELFWNDFASVAVSVCYTYYFIPRPVSLLRTCVCSSCSLHPQFCKISVKSN